MVYILNSLFFAAFVELLYCGSDFIHGYVLQAMLMFIYSDNLPESQEVTGSMSMCTSTNIIQHLLAAADRFGLDRLKQLCEAKLCEEVNVDTVATTLSLADQHRCSQLKAICLKFAAANLGGACCP